ncbi:MAG: flagellar FlbD family protein [Fibrobacteria bacterium]|nr:flagellar FlbD family protein [Fibrobacteria bacterium]
MIQITKLNKEQVYVNPDLIEFIEMTPDTALLMQGGKRMVIRDSAEDVVEQILKYKQFVHSNITVRKPSE